MTEEQPGPDEALSKLNRLFVKALRRLDDSGREHEACRIAAEGWSVLRRVSPREAERLNGVLHYLTSPKKGSQSTETGRSDDAKEAVASPERRSAEEGRHDPGSGALHAHVDPSDDEACCCEPEPRWQKVGADRAGPAPEA